MWGRKFFGKSALRQEKRLLVYRTKKYQGIFLFSYLISYKMIDYCHCIVKYSKLNVKSNAIQQMQLSLLAVLGLSPKKLMFQNPKQNGLKWIVMLRGPVLQDKFAVIRKKMSGKWRKIQSLFVLDQLNQRYVFKKITAFLVSSFPLIED